MLNKRAKSFFSIGVYLFIFSCFLNLSFAQSMNSNLAVVSQSKCDDLISGTAGTLTAEDRTTLEICLQQLTADAAKIQKDLTNKQGERKGMESELSIINSKISKSKNQIKQTATTIKKLGVDINDKVSKIQILGQNIQQNVQYISNTLVAIRKLDDVRAVVAYSGDQTFSNLFGDEGSYKSLQGSLSQNLDSLNTNKKIVEVEKDVLSDKKDQTEALKKKQEQDKKAQEEMGQEKKDLITVTKQQEKSFAKDLADKQAKVNKIKTRLFALRDTAGISFDKAQQYAKEAGKLTGIRPALILGILKQESNLGGNVGRCYMTDNATGNGINADKGYAVSRVMNPGRDVATFLQITNAVGRDPHKTRVSCPLSYGYGGAMGPTQFIPSTWQMYQARVISMAGGLGDPWNPKDAITATALYLSDGGAASGNYLDERNAACKYYSGKSCARGVGAAGYGNSVMNWAEGFQKDIDLLGGN